MKICLDPGHYGSDYNPGIAAGYVESNFTWTYYKLMKERLERFGVEVIGTRASKDEDMGLQARGRCSEGCDLFISIHSNAALYEDGSINPEVNSVFAHWSVRSGGEMIAKKIGNALTDFFRSEWGSCQAPTFYAQESEKHPGYDYFGVLKGAASVGTPGVIIEHSFHTNYTYCEWVMAGRNMERMADVEVNAIAEFYGLSPISNSPYYIPLDVDLKKGDKGEEVRRMQMRFRQINAEYDEEVRRHSFTAEGLPDGSFGGNMQKTVKKFQYEIGLPETGELDAATRMILNKSVIEYANQVTDLLRTNTELQEYYEKQLLEVDHNLQTARVKIESAIRTLSD